jgi:hypothetical protein
MKTTVDIADPLLMQAKRLASKRGTTLKALMEQGLRQVIADKAQATPYEFVPVTDNMPVAPGSYAEMTWDQMLDVMYEGRGA